MITEIDRLTDKNDSDGPSRESDSDGRDARMTRRLFSLRKQIRLGRLVVLLALVSGRGVLVVLHALSWRPFVLLFRRPREGNQLDDCSE